MSPAFSFSSSLPHFLTLVTFSSSSSSSSFSSSSSPPFSPPLFLLHLFTFPSFYPLSHALSPSNSPFIPAFPGNLFNKILKLGCSFLGSSHFSLSHGLNRDRCNIVLWYYYCLLSFPYFHFGISLGVNWVSFIVSVLGFLFCRR